MFADLVRLAFFLKERADLYLFTGFLYIIFILLLRVWCHLAQLHQVMQLCYGLFSRLFRGSYSRFNDFGSDFFDQSEFLGLWSIIRIFHKFD